VGGESRRSTSVGVATPPRTTSCRPTPSLLLVLHRFCTPSPTICACSHMPSVIYHSHRPPWRITQLVSEPAGPPEARFLATFSPSSPTSFSRFRRARRLCWRRARRSSSARPRSRSSCPHSRSVRARRPEDASPMRSWGRSSASNSSTRSWMSSWTSCMVPRGSGRP
jgi:hypothetical protein